VTLRVVPAVDIRGGRCVRLHQGDYEQETVYSEDPVAQARAWRDQGASLIHIVDLDGAKAGRVCIEEELRALAADGIPFEVGGGIRTMDTIEKILASGAQRVILGTAAHRDPVLLEQACAAFPGQIVVGIDARDGKVALQGWLEETGTDAIAFAQSVEAKGAARIIYTDIHRDGTLSGPNIEATCAVARAISLPVTVSGGISSLNDIHAVAAAQADGIDEVIVGRALYAGAFTLPEALEAAETPA
jgi:phosphoribosylformimino-5-aminoimidazole carboxamide ribotide isomerase